MEKCQTVCRPPSRPSPNLETQRILEQFVCSFFVFCFAFRSNLDVEFIFDVQSILNALQTNKSGHPHARTPNIWPMDRFEDMDVNNTDEMSQLCLAATAAMCCQRWWAKTNRHHRQNNNDNDILLEGNLFSDCRVSYGSKAFGNLFVSLLRCFNVRNCINLCHTIHSHATLVTLPTVFIWFIFLLFRDSARVESMNNSFNPIKCPMSSLQLWTAPFSEFLRLSYKISFNPPNVSEDHFFGMHSSNHGHWLSHRATVEKSIFFRIFAGVIYTLYCLRCVITVWSKFMCECGQFIHKRLWNNFC